MRFKPKKNIQSHANRTTQLFSPNTLIGSAI